MGKYLKISNTATNVSRISLEKLGLSTKRNNTETIGQFGSGIKYAPIAALRNGWEWAFVGYDDYGDYVMKYAIVNENGIDCIQYDYGDYCKPSSFTIDAGTLSWTEPFQIYREAVSNAMDGAKENDGVWSVSLVNHIDYELDVFSVYITAAPEIVAVYNDHDLYFSNNRVPICSQSSGRFILPKVDNKLRVYCHDVLVYSSKNNSIFDYRFDKIELNEERTVKSDYSLNFAIETAICSTNSKKVIEKVIDSCISTRKFHEFENGSNFAYIDGYNFDSHWVEYFKSTYGENAVIVDKATSQMNIDATLKVNGLKGFVINSDPAYKLLKTSGIPCIWDRLTESVKYDIDEEINMYPKLMEAISLARLAEPGLETYIPSIGVFKNQDRNILGVTINMKEEPDKRRILICDHHASSGSVDAIISTLIHEYDHASTGIADAYDLQGRNFRDIADIRIGRLITKGFRKNTLTISNGMVGCPAKDISSLGFPLKYSYEYSILLNAYVVITNNLKFIAYVDDQADSDCDIDVAMIMDDDAEMFLFDKITNVKGVSIV
jgi:hypothetical protein